MKLKVEVNDGGGLVVDDDFVRVSAAPAVALVEMSWAHRKKGWSSLDTNLP